MSIML